MERRCAEESTDIGGEEEEVEVEEALWNKETIPRVMKIVCTCIKLHQRDLISLLLVSPWLHRTLISHPSIWLVSPFLLLTPLLNYIFSLFFNAQRVNLFPNAVGILILGFTNYC